MFEGSAAIDIIKQSLMNDDISPFESILLAERVELTERERKILEWGSYYFADKFSSDFCELHEYLVSIRNHKFTSTLAPRGHAKTTIMCFLIPIYQALVEPDTFKHYIQVQSTATKALSANSAIRNELMNNEKLINDYGDQEGKDKWTEKQFVLKNGIIFSAVGSEESMRGINYNNIRPDFFMVDDLFDDKDIRNPDSTEKKVNWFWSTLYPSKVLMSENYCFHILGTAINKKDLMHTLSKSKDVTFKKFQAIIDYEKKITLWKDFDLLMKEKEMICLGSSSIFEREYQNECRSDQDSIIKERWLKFYNGEIPAGEKIVKTFCGHDPAVGKEAHHDFWAKAVIYKTNYGNYYIHGVRNEHTTFHENEKDCKRLHDRFNFSSKSFRIESIVAFQFIGQELSRKTNVPVNLIKCVPDKLTRLENQSGKFENGKVWINNNIPQKLKDELIEQLINNSPIHDDLRDAVVIVLEEDNSKKGLRVSTI